MLAKLTLPVTPSDQTSNAFDHASANLAVLHPTKRFIRFTSPLRKRFLSVLSMDEILIISSPSGDTAAPVAESCCTLSQRSSRECPQYHTREIERLLKVLSFVQRSSASESQRKFHPRSLARPSIRST